MNSFLLWKWLLEIFYIASDIMEAIGLSFILKDKDIWNIEALKGAGVLSFLERSFQAIWAFMISSNTIMQ